MCVAGDRKSKQQLLISGYHYLVVEFVKSDGSSEPKVRGII